MLFAIFILPPCRSNDPLVSKPRASCRTMNFILELEKHVEGAIGRHIGRFPVFDPT